MVMYIITALVATYVVAQLFKVAYFSAKAREFYWKAVFLPGGMPSVHTTTATALAMAFILSEGFTALTVAVIACGFLIAYDSVTLRREVAYQKGVLSKLHLKIEKKEVKTLLDEQHIGHTVLEAIVGVALGVLVPLVIYAIGIPW